MPPRRTQRPSPRSHSADLSTPHSAKQGCRSRNAYAELTHPTLLQAGVLVLLLHRQFGILDLRLQPRVARQADDVVHARALAVVHDALAAKPRVAPEDDAYVGPCLAQPLYQQLEDRRGMLRTVDAAGAQVRAQQLLATEHVQRQVAVAVVVAVEEAALLLAVQRVVGGIEVQHQFLRRGVEAGDELIDQHPM